MRAELTLIAATIGLVGCTTEPRVVAQLVAPDGVTSAVVTEWGTGGGATGELNYRVSVCRNKVRDCTSIAHGEWMGVGYMQWFTENDDSDVTRTVPTYRLRLGLQGGTADGPRKLKTAAGTDIVVLVMEGYSQINWDLGVYGIPRDNKTWVRRSTAGPCYQNSLTGEEQIGLRNASDRNPFRCPPAATSPAPPASESRKP